MLMAGGTVVSSVCYAISMHVFYIVTIVSDIAALIVSIVCFVLYEKRGDHEKPMSKHAGIAILAVTLCGIVNMVCMIGKLF